MAYHGNTHRKIGNLEGPSPACLHSEQHSLAPQCRQRAHGWASDGSHISHFHTVSICQVLRALCELHPHHLTSQIPKPTTDITKGWYQFRASFGVWDGDQGLKASEDRWSDLIHQRKIPWQRRTAADGQGQDKWNESVHCRATSRKASHAWGCTRHNRFLGHIAIQKFPSSTAFWRQACKVTKAETVTKLAGQRSAGSQQLTVALMLLASGGKCRKIVQPNIKTYLKFGHPHDWNWRIARGPNASSFLMAVQRRPTWEMSHRQLTLWARQKTSDLGRKAGSKARCRSSFRQRRTRDPEPQFTGWKWSLHWRSRVGQRAESQ